MRDEVSTGKVQEKLGHKSVNTAVYNLGIALRQAYRCGMLSTPNENGKSESADTSNFHA